MATRYVVGDPVVLTNTFTVAGVATDPTTVSLAVTDPGGTTDTYTYAGGTVTKSSTGVYTKTITTDDAGTWTYVWTGTGTAADVADGSFEVWPVTATTTTDIVTLGEAKAALNMSGTTHDNQLMQWISGVSQRIDELCGPVVVRAVTGELHDGGRHTIWLHKTPISSVTTVTEYSGTTGTVLTAETNASKPANAYLLDGFGEYDRLLRRRSADADDLFASGRRNVEVDYVAGRYADTTAVAAKFKLAAGAILRRLWQREQGAWAVGGDPFEAGAEGVGSIGFFKAVDPMVRELLSDELRPPAVA